MATTTRDVFAVDEGFFLAPYRYFGYEPVNEYVKDRSPLELPKQETHKVSGLPLWKIQVFVEGYGFANIKVPAAVAPEHSALDYLTFKNLRVGAYNGKLWFVAEGVELVD